MADQENKPVVQADTDVKVPVAESTTHLIIEKPVAPPYLPKQTLDIKGTIEAPLLFAKHRDELLDRAQCHVLADLEKYEVKLIVNETGNKAEHQHTITGRLEVNPDLLAFGINMGDGSPKMFTVLGLRDHLRLRKMYFEDAEEYYKLMEALSNFEAGISVQNQVAHDIKTSNRSGSIDVKTTARHYPFRLTIPLFKGEKAVTFWVEANPVATNEKVQYWLDSVELVELLHKQGEERIGGMLLDLEQMGFLVINV